MQIEQVKKIKGRKDLKDYGDEDKIKHSYLLKRNLQNELIKINDPLIQYLNRYLKESGF